MRIFIRVEIRDVSIEEARRKREEVKNLNNFSGTVPVLLYE